MVTHNIPSPTLYFDGKGLCYRKKMVVPVEVYEFWVKSHASGIGSELMYKKASNNDFICGR